MFLYSQMGIITFKPTQILIDPKRESFSLLRF